MACWLFKQSEQSQYGDHPGEVYVYNNTHSRRVSVGDEFIYLDKRAGKYAFNGHGVIQDIESRGAVQSDRLNPRVKTIFTAILCDYIAYDVPLDVRRRSVVGSENRTKLGISDFNRHGWSSSVARIDQPLFDKIVDLAYVDSIKIKSPGRLEYEVSDKWSDVKRRDSQERFRAAVIGLQGQLCAICGTTLEEVLEVAHISSYATDAINRANPANGIVMCTFCHRAFDRAVFRLDDDGNVTMLGNYATMMDRPESDAVVKAHFPGLPAGERLELIGHVDFGLLRQRSAETLG